jgi:uncharacterized lipoprotein NlpE involved in copper resistance
MKKLIITAALLIITLTGCSNDENNVSTGGVTAMSTTTNRLMVGSDVTNDGIENFIYDRTQDQQIIWFFDYQVTAKTITLSCLVNNVKTVVYVYTVDSDKNGDLKSHFQSFYCTFRFASDTEVDQIVEMTTGKQIVKYYFQKN